MNKKRIQILGSVVLTTSLIFSTANAVMAAPAKSTKDVTTGRTEQNRQTGVITFDPVTVPHYAKSVTLTGTVVIDGPQLVLKVNDADVSTLANLQKVADKTWTYSYTYDLSGKLGDVNFTIDAYTIYPNGQPSPDIHTSALKVTQTIHVPYVVDLGYNLSWDNYHRDSNLFDFSYNIIKTWDDGTKAVEQRINATVLGDKTFEIKASDETYNNGQEKLLDVVAPPLKVRDYFVSDVSFTDYDKNTNTYNLTFNLYSELSTGTINVEAKTAKVVAGNSYEYTAIDTSKPQFPGEPYTETFTFTAPAAPASTQLTVKDAEATVTRFEELANNEDKNNYKVTYDLKVTLSDGTTYTFTNNIITIPYNTGNHTGSKSVTEYRTINGITYTVSYTVIVNP